MKNNKIVRHIVIAAMIAVLFIFMIVVMLFRQSVSQIGKDPSLNFLSDKATFRAATLINLNKNKHPDRIDECWNQMNPLVDCIERNRLEEGNYILGGTDSNWFERSENFEISKERLKYTQGLIADRTYFQKIHISYPNENEMLVRVETWNNFGEADPKEITLLK